MPPPQRALAVAGALLLAACGGAASQPAPSSAGQPAKAAASTNVVQQISVATPSKSLSWFPLYVAVEKGFFKEQGLEVNIKQMTPPAQIAAVAAGEIDYTTAFGSAIQAASQGLDIKTVFAICAKPQHVLVATSAIQSVKDLKGKTVAISTLGSTTERELTLVLEQEGMKKTDVSLIPLGDSPSIVAGFAAGRVDASVLPVPDNFIVEKQSGGHTLLNIGQLVDAPLSGLSASSKTLASQPDRTVALIRGALAGIGYTKSHKDEVVAMIVQFSGVDASTASQAYDLVKDTWSDSGIVSDEALRNTFVEPEKAAALNPATVVDWSFARRAKG